MLASRSRPSTGGTSGSATRVRTVTTSVDPASGHVVPAGTALERDIDGARVEAVLVDDRAQDTIGALARRIRTLGAVDTCPRDVPRAGLGAERLPLDQPERDDEVDQRHEQQQPDEDELERRRPALGSSAGRQSKDSTGACAVTSIRRGAPSRPTSGSVARTVISTAGWPSALVSRTATSAAYSPPTVRRHDLARARGAPSSSDVSASAAWIRALDGRVVHDVAHVDRQPELQHTEREQREQRADEHELDRDSTRASSRERRAAQRPGTRMPRTDVRSRRRARSPARTGRRAPDRRAPRSRRRARPS